MRWRGGNDWRVRVSSGVRLTRTGIDRLASWTVNSNRAGGLCASWAHHSDCVSVRMRSIRHRRLVYSTVVIIRWPSRAPVWNLYHITPRIGHKRRP